MFYRVMLFVVAMIAGFSCSHAGSAGSGKKPKKRLAIALKLSAEWDGRPPFRSNIIALNGQRATLAHRQKNRREWSVSIMPILQGRGVIKLLIDVKQRRPSGVWRYLSRPTIITRLGKKVSLTQVLRKGHKPLFIEILPTLKVLKTS